MTVVFFDLDGTLLRQERAFDDLRRDAAAAVDADYPEDAHGFQTERFLSRFESFDDAPYREAFADVVDIFDLDVRPDDLRDAYVDAEVAGTEPPPKLRETLAALGESYPLGVLSNGYRPVQTRKLTHHGLDGAFDATVYSYDVGAHKPDPAIFEAAAERLSAEDGRYVYVGDDPEADVGGAAAAGWSTVHVTADDPAPAADAAVDPGRLDRLPSVVDDL